MAKKKKKAAKPPREFTKRQLSKWQQQRRRQRIILSAGISIIAVALVIMVVGWYVGQYRPLHETAIRVNDTEFNMKYFIEMLKRGGESRTADAIVNDIVQNELIRQGASKLGVSVSDDEIREKLKSDDLPTDDITKDLVRIQMLVEKMLEEYFEYQVPKSAEQAQVMAMLLESESQATEVSARLENSDNFTALAEELSLHYFSKAIKGDLGWHPRNILTGLLGTSVPVEYAFNSEVGALSQPIYDEEIIKSVGYWLIKVLDREVEGEEAHVHAMLLGSEEEAKDIGARLAAGEDFATLAKEFSRLYDASENGGDLGLVTQGMYPPAFDEFVFDDEVEPETLSESIHDESVETKGGYWLIELLDKDDDRQLEDRDREILKDMALEEWVTSLWDDPGNEVDDSILDTAKKEWALEQAMKD